MLEEFRLQSPLADRPAAKRIGLIALATDHTIEKDFRCLVARDGLSVHVTRVCYANPTTPENLRAMRPHLAEAARLILPEEDLDAIVYGCTSASVVIGEEDVVSAVTAGKPDVHVITPAGAGVQALRALKASRISVLTPYVESTAQPMQAYFEERGFGVDRLAYLNMEDDRDMARISPQEIARLACASVSAQTQAIFIACTSLRAAEAAPAIEKQTGLPVVTSNLASAWACLRRCEVQPEPNSSLRLLRLPTGEIH